MRRLRCGCGVDAGTSIGVEQRCWRRNGGTRSPDSPADLLRITGGQVHVGGPVRVTGDRPGFTIIELIVATAIATLLGGTIVMSLTRQQRFYSTAGEMLAVRSELRDAANVLVADIRGAAVATHGLPLMTDSAIEMVTTIGSSVLCADPSGSTISLPPSSLANRNTPTSFLATPDDDDIVALYRIPLNASDAGSWETSRVTSFSTRSVASACPASSGVSDSGGMTSRGFSVTLAEPPSAAVRKGAPARFLRRVRYSLYRSSDTKWYLGYRRCGMLPLSSCDAVQPVSGPYNSYSSGAGAGLSFRYYNMAGAEVVSGTGVDVSRVDIVLRGATARGVMLTGDGQRVFRDSAAVTVSPRNRLR